MRTLEEQSTTYVREIKPGRPDWDGLDMRIYPLRDVEVETAKQEAYKRTKEGNCGYI